MRELYRISCPWKLFLPSLLPMIHRVNETHTQTWKSNFQIQDNIKFKQVRFCSPKVKGTAEFWSTPVSSGTGTLVTPECDQKSYYRMAGNRCRKQNICLFPFVHCAQPKAGWSSAALGRKVMLQSSSYGIFCETEVTSAKLSPAISSLKASLRQEVWSISDHSGLLENLPFGLTLLF